MKLSKYKRLKAKQEIQEIKDELYSKGYLLALKYLPLDINTEGKLEQYYAPIKDRFVALANDVPNFMITKRMFELLD